MIPGVTRQGVIDWGSYLAPDKEVSTFGVTNILTGNSCSSG